MKHVIKRHGHKENFDERKLYASLFASCLAASMSENEAELVSEKVTQQVREHLEKNNDPMTSEQLLKTASAALEQYSKAAGILYRHHKDLR